MNGMGTQLPRMRFNPPPNWPPAPAGWTPPAGWEPDVAWGPLPPGWPLWVEAKQRSWFARHKVLSSIGASVLGMFLLLCVIASVAGTTTQAGQDLPADVASTSNTDDKAGTEKAANESAAAETAAAEKATAEAERAASEQQSTYARMDGEQLGAEAVRASAESSQTPIKLLKVRSPRVVQDNRHTYTVPTGTKMALILSCSGVGVWSNGDEETRVLIELKVDADEDAFIYYEAIE